MPHTIAAVMSARMASLHELGSVLGLVDLWDMLEVLMVDAHNERIAQRKA
ncbi:transcription elongation factor GreA [uncultured Pseudacidovorax sp.]|nr:transcription elongation factor GreA [uncultured Pseudacidovorax sp.]